MPQRKSNGAKIASARDYQPAIHRVGESKVAIYTVHPFISKRTQSSNLEVPSRTITKRTKARQPPSRGKRQRRSVSGADTEAKDTSAEDIYTPLTRPNIQMIVNAGLSNLTTSSTGETKNTPDNAPLSE